MRSFASHGVTKDTQRSVPIYFVFVSTVLGPFNSVNLVKVLVVTEGIVSSQLTHDDIA